MNWIIQIVLNATINANDTVLIDSAWGLKWSGLLKIFVDEIGLLGKLLNLLPDSKSDFSFDPLSDDEDKWTPLKFLSFPI